MITTEDYQRYMSAHIKALTALQEIVDLCGSSYLRYCIRNQIEVYELRMRGFDYYHRRADYMADAKAYLPYILEKISIEAKEVTK